MPPPEPSPGGELLTDPSQDNGRGHGHEIEIGGVLATAAIAVADGSSLETLSRPLLGILHDLADLESVYLTEIRPASDDQVIRFSDNRAGSSGINVPENLVMDWEDTVCRYSLESGLRSTDDVGRDFPASTVAISNGMRSYAGVPVVTADNLLLGTLCAADSRSIQISARFVEVMQMLAKVIADQWQRDRSAEAALLRADAAEDKLVERATFLAEAEHLLKSPLTVLRGWSEMLADDWDEMSEDERSDALQTMRRASRDAAQQLEQLLEEARGEVLSHRLAPAPVRLDEIVGDVVDQLRTAAAEHHEVRGRWPDSPEGDVGSGQTVIVDRYALWQVLWHLGENAVKYSPSGGLIEYVVQPGQPDGLLIEVRDEGIGIPSGVDIFAPFVRGMSTHTGTTKGTGLGLHIVRTLVQAMGGTVSAERGAERGSVFRVLLPAAAEPDPDHEPDLEPDHDENT